MEGHCDWGIPVSTRERPLWAPETKSLILVLPAHSLGDEPLFLWTFGERAIELRPAAGQAQGSAMNSLSEARRQQASWREGRRQLGKPDSM